MTKIFESLKKTDTRHIIALLMVVGALTFIMALLVARVPAGNENMVNVLSGMVLANLASVIGYYFGASKRSDDELKHP
jgi:hypothetical protein